MDHWTNFWAVQVLERCLDLFWTHFIFRHLDKYGDRIFLARKAMVREYVSFLLGF